MFYRLLIFYLLLFDVTGLSEESKVDTQVGLRKLCHPEISTFQDIELEDGAVAKIRQRYSILRKSPALAGEEITRISHNSLVHWRGQTENQFIRVSYNGYSGWLSSSTDGKSALCYPTYVKRRICDNLKATIFSAPGIPLTENGEKQFVEGQELRFYGLASQSYQGKYFFVKEDKDDVGGREYWILGQNICHVIDSRVVTVGSVPYLSQRLNSNNPNGTCGVTSLAMTMSFLLDESMEPDSLYFRYYSQAKTPEGMASAARDLGAKRSFGTKKGSFDRIKKELRKGNTVIAFGYFTGSGHILVIYGYDEKRKELLIHDPYGKWNESTIGQSGGYPPGSAGYRKGTRTDGAAVRYSYSSFLKAASPDGYIWMTVIQN